MKKSFFSIISAFLLMGCGQNVSEQINKDPIFIRSLQYSQIIKISDSKDEIKLIGTVSYLNSIQKDKYNGHHAFLVGIYDNSSSDAKAAWGRLEFRLNNTQVESSRTLKSDSPLIQDVGIRNKWSEYKVILFPRLEQKVLKLTVKAPAGKQAVYFEQY
jgi:hypothetical protein